MKYPHSTHLPSLLALACLTALSAPVLANDDIETESVVVTGSRIVNPNVISPSPISTLSADDIKASGAVNIGDVLTKIPQLATTFTMGNSGRYIGTAGVASQNLRNMGTARTLVLVNGRRFVGASAGSSEVDTNLIPASFIERVEVLTGGASAVYGADAVTGVINFVLKKDYEGLDSNAQFGMTEAGHKKRFASLTGGTNFAEERGNIAFSVERSEQDSLSFGKRFGNQSYAYLKKTTPGYGQTLWGNAGSYTTNEGGVFVGKDNKRYVLNDDGTPRLQRFDGAKDNTACSDCDFMDSNQTIQLEPEYNRSSLNLVSGFDLSENHRVFFEGTHSQSDIWSTTAPSFSSTRYVPAGYEDKKKTGHYRLAADNAYITPELARVINSADGVLMRRTDVDAGVRGFDIERTTSRIVLGAEGFISEDWAYDGHINYGVTEDARANLNNRIEDRFFAAIDAVRDPSTGQIVCRSTLDPNSRNTQTGRVLDSFATAGCVPTSLFGAGAINPAARDWFNTTTHTDGRLTQYVAGATVSNNNLFEMPGDAGSASLVVGSEYRRETSREDTDPLDVAGRTFFNAIPSSHGAYDVQEGFAQLALPVLTDKFLAKSLSLDAAARYSDYSSIGATKAWRYGFDWGIDDNVRLRGTKSLAMRAPNIGELYSGQSQSFFSLTDPCLLSERPNAKNPAIRAANCTALGIPADFESDVTSRRPGVIGSNPNLAPETGETWTLGVVLTPAFIPNLSLTVDYWDIELTDAITNIDGQTLAERCVDSVNGIDNIYCRNVTRGANGEVSFINSISQNISASTSSGYDIEATYNHELLGGELKYRLNVTQVRDYTDYPFQDAPDEAVDNLGILGAPEWKGQLQLSYVLDAFGLTWTQRHASSMLRVDNSVYRVNPRSQAPYHAASANFSDMKASYNFDDSLQGYFGITNVFDRQPPVAMYGTGEGSALYDAMGRGYYTGVNYSF